MKLEIKVNVVVDLNAVAKEMTPPTQFVGAAIQRALQNVTMKLMTLGEVESAKAVIAREYEAKR